MHVESKFCWGFQLIFNQHRLRLLYFGEHEFGVVEAIMSELNKRRTIFVKNVIWMFDVPAGLFDASVRRAARDVYINACKPQRRDLEDLASADGQLCDPRPAWLPWRPVRAS